MGLVFIDGFDHYAYADILKKWNSVGTNVGSFITGRNGSCFQSKASGNIFNSYLQKAFAATTTVCVGFALRIDTLPAGEVGQPLHITDGNVLHVILVVDGSSKQIKIGTSDDYTPTILATSSNALSVGIWNYVEVKVKIGDAGVGTYEVRVNGTSTGWIPPGVGDTRNGGNASANNIRVGSCASGSIGEMTASIDDLYIVDCMTSGLNDFLGDVMVETVYPNGNGTHSDFTGSDGNSTDNYLLVDEASFNTTDYNSSTGIGQQDTYAFASMTTATNIKAVQLNNMLKKDDAGTRTEQAVCISGATTAYGATGYPSTDFLDMSQIWETNPNTAGSWTASDLNAAEFGVKVVG